MFTVRKVTIFEGSCPNGHPLLPDLLPQTNHSFRYCYICGAQLEFKRAIYDAAYCSDCNGLVSPTWEHCPYCAQGRDW